MARLSARWIARSTALLAATTVVVGLVGCSPAAQTSGEPDDGSQLTMWVRSEGTVSQALVDAYNKGHENKVKLTIIPGDSYQQKVGAAAGSNSLPDLLSADVVYSPNYVDQGLYQDITDRVEALPFLDDLTPAHSAAASKDGKIYGVPHVVDSSLIVYNKDLYAAAGLDPEVGPSTFDDMYEQAKAVRESAGGDTYGFYFGGNCAGCNAYTMMPYLVAAGEAPLQDDGTTSNLDTPAMASVLELYQRMLADDIAPSAAANEDGSTWTASFEAGKVGILPIGNFIFSALADVDFDWGVVPLMSPDGSANSTFVGGDVIGISRNSKKVDQAWNFIEWTLGDEAQVDVVAKMGALPSRVDLADNQYTSKDPRQVQTVEGLADGYTPSALAYGEIYNSANGPWLLGLRSVIVNGGDPDDAVKKMQDEVQAIIDAD